MLSKDDGNCKKGRARQLFIYHNIKEGMPSRQNLNSNIISYFEIFKSLVLHSGILSSKIEIIA